MGRSLLYRATRAVVAIVGVFAPITLGAQVIRGFVYDDSSGARLPATAVMLVDPRTDAPVVNVKTDSLGQFTLKVGRGVYQLAAVRERYSPLLSAPIPLADGEMLTVRVPIASSGDPQHKIGVMEHIRSEASAAPAADDFRLGGFERRRRSASGGLHFDRAKLDQTPGRTVSDFLAMVPGVSVSDAALGATVQMRRNGGLSQLSNAASACRVGWFIDGTRMDRGGMSDAFAQSYGSIRLDDVAALEVYRGVSEMPSEFAEPDLRCGAIVIWTKRG